MRFGTSLPIVQQTPGHAHAWEASAGVDELVRLARAADDLGFAWITCSDHVAVPASYESTMGATWYEPSTTLAYLAACTRRVRLLTHVVVLPYRHPLVVAKTFATLDTLSGGRVILGVGAGHLKPEFQTLGIDHASRVAISEESLQALTVALERETSTFEGRFVRWRDMIVSPRSVQRPRPPVWLGGNTGAVASRAAHHADGWIPWQLTPKEFASCTIVVREHLATTRPETDFALVAPLHVGENASADQVGEAAHVWRDAGATDFHVGFRHVSPGHLLERMAFFASEVGPLLC